MTPGSLKWTRSVVVGNGWQFTRDIRDSPRSGSSARGNHEQASRWNHAIKPTPIPSEKLFFGATPRFPTSRLNWQTKFEDVR